MTPNTLHAVLQRASPPADSEAIRPRNETLQISLTVSILAIACIYWQSQLHRKTLGLIRQ